MSYVVKDYLMNKPPERTVVVTDSQISYWMEMLMESSDEALDDLYDILDEILKGMKTDG